MKVHKLNATSSQASNWGHEVEWREGLCAIGWGTLTFCSIFLHISCESNLDIHVFYVLLKERPTKRHTYTKNKFKNEPDFDLLFWTECVVSSKFVYWNANPQLGEGDLQWWLGHEGGAIMSGISGFIKKTPKCSLILFPPPEDATSKCPSASPKRILTRTQPGWHPDIELLTQNYEKYISVYKQPKLLLTWKDIWSRGDGVAEIYTYYTVIPPV